ncbi:MAG TPA: hypothetical protein DCY42_09235 [Chloroflexi bacterium]|nr:hypothetical protein [Chloroflexota bacterium]
MNDTPSWALTIAFWLHMLATVSWVGGQAIISLVVLPLSRKTLAIEDHHKLLSAINKRMSSIGWIGLAVLVGTGMVQLSANDNYTGFLSIDSTWAVAILLKHLAFGGIILLSAYQTWGLAPAIERNTLLQMKGKATPEEQKTLRKREEYIQLGNVVLSVVVLFLTAVARIS